MPGSHRSTVAVQDATKVRRTKLDLSQAATHEAGPARQPRALPSLQALLAATDAGARGLDQTRAATIQRLQRDFGNRAVQLAVQRKHHKHKGTPMVTPVQQATMRVQLQDKQNTHHTVALNADWNRGVTYAQLSAALDALSQNAPNGTIKKAMRDAVQAQKDHWRGLVSPRGVQGENDSRSEYFGERGGWRVDVENIRGVNLRQ